MEEKSYRIRIDMLKLKGASVKNVNDENGQPKRYLVIPIDEADGFYVGQKGCYFSMRATPLQNRKYEDTHCVRAVLSKDRFQSMTKEQLMEVPILGGMQVNEYKQQAPAPEAVVQAPSMPAQPPIKVADLYQQAQNTQSELPF
jgi:hypothetical protein